MQAPEAPEIPNIPEQSPAGAKLDESKEQLSHGQEEAAAGEGQQRTSSLTLQLPPSSAADRVGRWSVEEGSVHSDSWELLSHGHTHSHCGSSPRSVSPSDAYDSEAEEATEEAGVQAQEPAGEEGSVPVVTAAPAAAAGGDSAAAPQEQQHPAVAGQHVEQMEAAPEPFGSPVVDSPSVEALAAAAPAASSPAAAEAAQVGEEEGGGKHEESLDGGSPRSSYEHASNTSRHDLYSLSQDGSRDNLSDRDSYIDDMMLQGEPDMHGGAEHAEHNVGADMAADEAKATKPPTLPLPARYRLAAGPAATVAAVARDAFCAASLQLRALAASFHAYLARIVPAGADVAQRVAMGLAGIVGSLRERIPAAVPAGLSSLAAPTAAAKERWLLAAQRTRNHLGLEHIAWSKVALWLGVGCATLGVACGSMATLLWRSYAEHARLSARLAKREGDMAKMLMHIFELRRNITAHRSVPIIRHVSNAAVAAAWPTVTVV